MMPSKKWRRNKTGKYGSTLNPEEPPKKGATTEPVTFTQSGNRNYFKRTGKQANGLPKNQRAVVGLSMYGNTLDGKVYEESSLIEIMEDLQKNDIFKKLSIPVYVNTYSNPTKPKQKMHHIVGYVKDYNIEKNYLTIIIYNKTVELYSTIKDPIMCPRVTIRDNKCNCIVGFDVVEKMDVIKAGKDNE